MNCPACERALTRMNAGGVEVDVCADGCGGIWFDQFELKKFDEPHEHAGEALLDVPRDANIKVDLQARRKCPHCQDTVLMQHYFSIKRSIVVDECPNCGGYWLDAGELSGIRAQFNTEAQREAAAAAFYDEVFDDALQKMLDESEAKAAKAKRIAHLFRFLCPSYYIPGKQTWGAF